MKNAKKTFLALANPYNSVIKTFPNIIDHEVEDKEIFYLGVKNVSTIPLAFVDHLEKSSIFQHTIDKASLSGRAVDLSLQNPITGKPMTGSSSGTAINVFLGINDIGLGTDGGGSVLAPAMALNLFSFIHPQLGEPYFKRREKKLSTDGHPFSPSLGFITKDYFLLEQTIVAQFNLIEEKNQKAIKIALDKEAISDATKYQDEFVINEGLDFSDKYQKSRNDLIKQLNELLANYDIVISKEGPIEVDGFGDTIFGHFDSETQKMQIKANKGFVRVVTMVGASAISVPCGEFAKGWLLICKSDSKSIQKMLQVASQLQLPSDEISNRYFGNINAYFENGV
ncbi:amidase family protein [Enterococcus sp. LJL99]